MPEKINLKNLPSKPGIYQFFNQEDELIYIGKASNLKMRVSSYFQKRQVFHSRPIEQLISKVQRVETQETDTVLEAFFLEQDLIKKHQPKYNILGKDDKSANFLVITDEQFPRLLIKRKTDLYQIGPDKEALILKEEAKKFKKIYGPYSSKQSIVTVLKILRKIFPFHNRKQKSESGCLAYQIGLCPGPYLNKISPQDYRKNIAAIEKIFQGKKKSLLKTLKKEMDSLAKKQQFEKAQEKRDQIFALEHIQDASLIDRPVVQSPKEKIYRIETYDISHTSGQNMVGSMVVFTGTLDNLTPAKEEYRKFKIKTVPKSDDTASMREVLQRRFSRSDWEKPDLIILDGGKGQLNQIKKLFLSEKIALPILAVAKGPTRKKLDFYTHGAVPKIKKRLVAQMRDEAHRFAITYHRKLRGRKLTDTF